MRQLPIRRVSWAPGSCSMARHRRETIPGEPMGFVRASWTAQSGRRPTATCIAAAGKPSHRIHQASRSTPKPGLQHVYVKTSCHSDWCCAVALRPGVGGSQTLLSGGSLARRKPHSAVMWLVGLRSTWPSLISAQQATRGFGSAAEAATTVTSIKLLRQKKLRTCAPLSEIFPGAEPLIDGAAAPVPVAPLLRARPPWLQALLVRFGDGETCQLPAEYLRIESPAAGNQGGQDAQGRPRVRATALPRAVTTGAAPRRPCARRPPMHRAHD